MENNKKKNYSVDLGSKTRSGIKAESFTYHYSPTTKDAEKYLQALITKQIRTWNSSKDKEGNDLPKLPEIDITLITAVYGHRKPGKKGKIKGNHFTPFMLVLPLEVQPDFSPKLSEDEWEGFYETDHNINERIGKRASLIKPVEFVIKAFGYNEYDINNGLLSYENSKSREFFQKFNIRKNSAEYKEIRSLVQPRLVHFSKTESRVVVYIDPLRLISDMVKRIDSNQDVYVKDVKSVQIKDTNYKYFIETRVRQKNTHNDSDKFYNSISEKDLKILSRNI